MKDFQFLLYKAADEDVIINTVIKDDTIWLTQKAMAELFGVQPPAISKHLNNIYEDGELQESATISILEIVQNEGGRQIKRKTQFYNLDAIISVGYRINSARATHFRIWATNTLREYIIKGFVMDDERLKQGKTTGNKSLTFSPSVASIMTKIRKLRANFTRWCKTNSTTPSPARPPQKLSIAVPIVMLRIWGSRPGKTPPTVASSNPT